ncbi:uncharacterized protein LOC133781989 [Humulus lupulus]|uniref:uncharacterized protein LOC133781989 n=1 Tax=Humulus lupulus TaxID=3486 RepID=UPI002B405B87|nr:uncharacterized protein LOC133781989 [Humulus lupulus]XP_062077099.1 uncharacterized protein LOC133781989 [Humulus lupulus]XP_062077100.1 uncharacterized protein LOC133781989 [Humulus lupulus]
MAAVATNRPQTLPEPTLKLDCIPQIDISSLSQTELHALSLCSSSAFDLHCTDDIVVPKIDRATFNESAGSRRQTYSRPRRSQSSSSSSSVRTVASAATGHRRRVAGLLPTPKVSHILADDPERYENRSIIDHLKRFISQDPKFNFVEFSQPSSQMEMGFNYEGGRGVAELDGGRDQMSLTSYGGERKRKRGRKPKLLKVQLEMQNVEPESYRGLEMVNRNGVAVDFSALGNADDPYGEEFRRRTVGLESEEALLGFLRELDGQWGSRRKKRKIVDASEFGDALPIGWKLLLGLKRKEGRAWIYCRRYISPNGQQFISCKDVSSYLQSVGCRNTPHLLNGHKNENNQEYRQITENHAGLIFKEGEQRQDLNSSSAAPTSTSYEQEKEVALFGMENLAEVQIHDLFECHKCSMTFDQKDAYLQHLLSFHQRTTRRYRLGSSVGDGVIIKDGKYECQFCHKVFLERRRYNGHVGIHVRNYVRKVEDVPGSTEQQKIESPTTEDLPAKISKMDALIEIAQSSILKTSARLGDGSKGGSAPDISLAIFSSEFPDFNPDHDMNTDSPHSEHDLDDCMIDQEHMDLQDNEHVVTDGTTEKTDGACEIVDVKMDSILDNSTLLATRKIENNALECFVKEDSSVFISDRVEKPAIELEGVTECDRLTPVSSQSICNVENAAKMDNDGTLGLEHLKPVQVNASTNNALEIDIEINMDGPTNNIAVESIQQCSEGTELHFEVSECSMSMLQPLPCFSSLKETSDKRQASEMGFEELRLEEIEPLQYSFVGGQDSSLQEVPIDLEGAVEMEGAFGSSVHFESGEVMLNMTGTRRDQLTACVWCGVEFNHNTVDSEMQSDSVGFICPTCKVRISGEFNELDNGSPVNHHPL